ncbi:MAG: CofH family radical SAM protein [Bacteroidales bacterium]
MNTDSTTRLLNRALAQEWLTHLEGAFLYRNAPLAHLMYTAHRLRTTLHNEHQVTWIADRNINYTNICTTRCRFCNFHRVASHPEAYVTTLDEYRQKIGQLLACGGNQILLQGGVHPDFDLTFYTRLFQDLKALFPQLQLHALGPHEINSLAQREQKSITEILRLLIDAGLDSLPGAGAEILSDRVRQIVSPGKCTVSEWLEVMRQAHALGLVTSATMMYGHAETLEERMEHLVLIRSLQAEKAPGNPGFISFTAWPFQAKGTPLASKHGYRSQNHTDQFLRMNALIRIMLPNIDNIQASWLTAGREAAQLSLWGGVNDMGSIMMEENVVSAAGAEKSFTNVEMMEEMIREAGFIPQKRDQHYRAV